jgi:peroxiredoxin Q/BCP
MIEVGRKAPAFTLPDQHGRKHAQRDGAGRPMVLYFYPKDDTPGCTQEACEFRDLLPRFDGAGATVFGISPDSSASHAEFAGKLGLDFTLLADAPGRDGVPRVCAKYGVWQEKLMFGRKTMGVVRTTYLIDAAGRVARRWDRVSVPGHAADVLEAVKAL